MWLRIGTSPCLTAMVGFASVRLGGEGVVVTSSTLAADVFANQAVHADDHISRPESPALADRYWRGGERS